MDKPPRRPARKSPLAQVARTSAAIDCRPGPQLPHLDAKSPSGTAKCSHESAESSPRNPATPSRAPPTIRPPARVASPPLAPHHPVSPYTPKRPTALAIAHPNKSAPQLPPAQAAYQKPSPSSAAPPRLQYSRSAQAFGAAPQS